MSEKIPNDNQHEAEVISFSEFREWQELKESAPAQAEELLSSRGLSCHEKSISVSESGDELQEIDDLVTEMENRFISQALRIADMTDEAEKIEAQKAYNQSRFVMRHLGYLREVARTRLGQLKLRGIAANTNEVPAVSNLD